MFYVTQGEICLIVVGNGTVIESEFYFHIYIYFCVCVYIHTYVTYLNVCILKEVAKIDFNYLFNFLVIITYNMHMYYSNKSYCHLTQYSHLSNEWVNDCHSVVSDSLWPDGL